MYLRLQYVTFLLYFRDNAALASVRLDEVLLFLLLLLPSTELTLAASMSADLEPGDRPGHAVLCAAQEARGRAQAARRPDGNSALGMDSISFEEVRVFSLLLSKILEKHKHNHR